MKAEIIAVGAELLTPDRLDTNSLFLTAQLNRFGIEVARKTVVSDDVDDIRNAFREALDRAEIVISSGGLGPTEDDRTRDAVAQLLGRRLQLNEDVLRAIEQRFQRFGRKMAEINKRQAMVPEGATILENSRGTAPGLWLEASERVVILLPGPPRELQPMFEDEVEKRLARRAPSVRLHHRQLRVAAMPESEVDQRIAPIYTAYSDVQTTVLAAPGDIEVHFRIWSADAQPAEKRLEELQQRAALALGASVYSTDGQTLEEVVGHQLTLHQATLATAESCTGGLVAERVTRVAGSSVYFLGSVVCYSNELKSAMVDVPAKLIAAHGAVSAEVAVALAEGIRRRVGATLGLGITGIAGPSGGSPEKPVGTVHIAVSGRDGTRERELHLIGDRERVRWQASQIALDMVRRHFLEGQSPHASGKG
jgi:nicotinamide-nucleotide amidase